MSRPRVTDAEILEAARLPNDITVTVYDWMADEVRNGRNLVATDRNGVELWRAKPLQAHDCFTGVSWDGVNLTAYTWFGYKVSIDPVSGDVAVIAFTK